MGLIETLDLTIGYHPEKVLQRGINFSLEKGQIITLMGQNGVGKTTFIKKLHGLLSPISGDINIRGMALSTMTRTDIARVFALVLTEKPRISNLSVRELIALGRYPHNNWLGWQSKSDRQAVERAIDLTRINYIADKKLSSLSDGQFQKAMIARALAQETEILVLDEPVAHLDLNNKIEILLLLRQIADEGKGIVVSTHDIQVSLQLSNLLWLFNFDAIPQYGLPEDLIINGQLEKALYLEHHNYDLVHHRLIEKNHGQVIALSGDEDVRYWTGQALVKAGFQTGESSIQIRCENNSWIYGDRIYQTLQSLIEQLKNDIPVGLAR